MTIERNALMIDGRWVRPSRTEMTPVICPSTEEVIGAAPNADRDDVDAAVTAARRAFDDGAWPRLSAAERAEVLHRALTLIEPRLDEIAHLVTSEMGVPLTIAQQLMPAALATGRFFLGVAARQDDVEIRSGISTSAVLKEPAGVVASIAPWNGPFNMAVAKVIPALVAGCTVVYKPAPETPLDAYFLAEALMEVGIPAGVFNLVTGGRDTGAAMVEHRGVDKVSFTGSTDAGRKIGAICGESFKRVQLELGGKSAAIILEDADLPTTLAGLAMGSFFNTGQVCASYSRVLAPRSRYEEIAAGLCETASSFTVGDPFEPATTMGPLVSERQRDRVEAYIEAGRAEGAKVLVGGERPADLSRGWYTSPTVFGECTNEMRISREEIFGPVVALIPYDGVDEAIRIANDSEYGLHGGVFTTDEREAVRVARSIRTGTFSVNSWTYNVEAPFGGVKCSGIGRDTGREAVESYYELKTVNLPASMHAAFAGGGS